MSFNASEIKFVRIRYCCSSNAQNISLLVSKGLQICEFRLQFLFHLLAVSRIQRWKRTWSPTILQDLL